MKISLLIPTKNREKELEHALNSVFSQTRIPDELVLIDDGNLTQEWRDRVIGSKIPLQYVKKDQPGTVRSRNLGIQIAEGDIVTQLDDDVELAPNYFEVIEKIFENDTDKKIGGVGTFIEHEEEGFMRKLKNFLERIFFIRGDEGQVLPTMWNTFVEKRPAGMVPVEWLPGCSVTFRKEALVGHQYETSFIDYGYGEDLVFSYQIYQKGRFTLMLTGETSLKHFHTPTARMAERKFGKMMIVHRRFMFEKLVSQTFKHRAMFVWSLFGTIVLEFLNKVSNPFKNRGGRIFGMFEGLFTKLPLRTEEN